LKEPWGPILTDPELQVLIVSEETLGGGRKGNEIRLNDKHFPAYELVCIPLLLPRGDCSDMKLSSSQLREMEIK